MEVLRRNGSRKSMSQASDRRDDLIAASHSKRPARQEIVLEVDEEERISDGVDSHCATPHPRSSAYVVDHARSSRRKLIPLRQQRLPSARLHARCWPEWTEARPREWSIQKPSSMDVAPHVLWQQLRADASYPGEGLAAAAASSRHSESDMERKDDLALARTLAEAAQPIGGAMEDFDPLMELIGDARCVLIGEATHGTHEFYRVRAQLTKRLILEKGFAAVAAEADWPDAYRVNRYLRGLGADAEAVEALAGFRRFPAWMWRNADVLDFVGWLRMHNDSLDAREKVGFYGLDLYSLHASIGAVLRYLDRVDPEAAIRARNRYACFEHFGEDAQAYGYATSFDLKPDCEQEVVLQLLEMQRQREDVLRRDGLAVEDEQFEAEQNARVVKDAEEYYRSMFQSQISSWNLRDTHMARTLEALLAHLGRRRERPKVVVWAHNSHVGDARATELGGAGQVNLGQLVRERSSDGTVLVGFSTYTGTVTAASQWEGPAERKQVRAGLSGSYEELLHRTGLPSFLLTLRDLGEAAGGLREPRLERAIGVVYLPETERLSHYFHVRLPLQFDALMHIDQTRALEPLERTVAWVQGEAPETYPTGM
jgi:erythromycin esterase-like protein